MIEHPPRPPARAARVPASLLQSRIRDLCVASEGAMSRSVCNRCVQDSPTVYCWRLGGSRLELGAPDRPAGPRDYDSLCAAVSALLDARPDEAATVQGDAAREAAQAASGAAFRAIADGVHAARARVAAPFRNGERA